MEQHRLQRESEAMMPDEGLEFLQSFVIHAEGNIGTVNMKEVRPAM
jgi:hypothetical protein